MIGNDSTLGVVSRLGRAQLEQTMRRADVGRAGRDRPEVALLHFGTAADVTGMRLEDIHPDTVAEVVDAYPRQGFKEFFADKVRKEARAHPASATAALCRWGQFTWRIKQSPFSE